MPNVKDDGTWLYLYGAPSSDDKMMATFFSGTYSKPKRHWRLARNRHVMRELFKAFPDLRQNAEFIHIGHVIQSDYTAKIAAIRDIPPLKDEHLRPYQAKDAGRLVNMDAAGVFNDPRTGKTPTMIAALKELGHKRNLVVCPASLMYNWRDEFQKWWPECEVHVVDGTPRQKEDIKCNFSLATYKDKCAVLIISKNGLKVLARPHKMETGVCGIEEFDTMVVDEAHFLRNYGSQQSEALYKVKAAQRFALTGTPTVKHPSDMYGILKFLFPKEYPSYWQFCDRYFYEEENRSTGGKLVGGIKQYREEEFKELIALVSTQRKRKDVMPWLPEKERITIPVKMTPKQTTLYNDMKKWFVAQDEEAEVDAQNIITQLMRLRQLSLDPRLLDFTEQGSKTKAVIEWLENNPEPVVIMSMFTSYLKLLKPLIQKLGLRVGEINGEVSGKQKQNAATMFQAGKIEVLLCNVISAGTGFTLDRSTTVLFLDTAWNPSDNDQAEDRVCPTSQERNHKHTIINFVAEGTVDERMVHILRNKRDLTDFINNGGWAAAKGLV